jgi:hypothetical protein
MSDQKAPVLEMRARTGMVFMSGDADSAFRPPLLRFFPPQFRVLVQSFSQDRGGSTK